MQVIVVYLVSIDALYLVFRRVFWDISRSTGFWNCRFQQLYKMAKVH